MTGNFAILILAAGLGTRMKSRIAKVLHRAGGKTLIELVTGTTSRLAPPDRVYVVVGYQAEMVQRVLHSSGTRVVLQSQQLGTGHAVLAARQALESADHPRVLVLYGDCPLISGETLSTMMHRHVEWGAAATVLTTHLEDPTGYGRIVRKPNGAIEAIVEERAATPEQRALKEINSGIYCFETGPLFQCLERIRPNNPAGEYYLTDVIGCMVQRDLSVAGFTIPEAWQVLGINTRVELAEVDAVLRTRRARELMLSGVTLQRPETVTLDADVSIGPDTILEPFVQVLGHSEIGSGCLIRSYSIISDSAISEDVIIEPFCCIHESEVEHGARIGPFARLRTGNHVAVGARVGNFVELKKARLGPGSKAMHLAYLGDSNIGAGVNIGAGTITCNYDGVSKHPTVIDDGAFVGSNSTLVAPVRVGAEAYLAAGSVITDEVEPGALAIARGRQVNKPGWVAKRREKV